MYVSAIVLAAGRGRRLGAKKNPKPLVKIGPDPIVIYSLSVLGAHPLISEIILVASRANRQALTGLVKKSGIKKIKNIVLGGRRRQDSVRQGLAVLDQRCGLVLVHDAARPFIDKSMVSELIKKAQKVGAAILGVPVKATIKKIRGQGTGVRGQVVEKTLNRENLWEIQTPQVFKKDLILKAYRKFGTRDVTDDAVLIEKMGGKVSMVFGSYKNIKITTPEDLIIAEALCHTKSA